LKCEQTWGVGTQCWIVFGLPPWPQKAAGLQQLSLPSLSPWRSAVGDHKGVFEESFDKFKETSFGMGGKAHLKALWFLNKKVTAKSCWDFGGF